MSEPIDKLHDTVRTQAGSFWAYVRTANAVYDRCVVRRSGTGMYDLWYIGWETKRDKITGKSKRTRTLKYETVMDTDVVRMHTYDETQKGEQIEAHS